MKSARNNEIDLLLRKLGRRNSDGSANSTVPEDLPAELEAHLDADELSAYAEDALPASARAHYTEHLADCTRCRKIVSQLAVSAGSVKPAANVGPEQQTFRQFFASLFAPAVLRYVVPSLAAVIVLGMALMVMRYRTPSKSDLVAENRPVASPVANVSAPASNPAAPAQPDLKQFNSSDGRIANDSVKPSEDRSTQLQEEKTKIPAKSLEDNAKVAREVDRSDAAANAELKPGVARNETAAAAAPKPVSLNNEPADKLEAEKQKKPEAADQPVASKDEDRQRKVGKLSAAEGPAKGQAAPYVGGTLGVISPDREATRRARDKKTDDAEVRSVAGRRFRREGSVWVDTGFDSSTPTVNVTRGSEQFRALVADEPAIKTIAEQLDGEIVVVWKKQAYRIH